MNGSVVAVAVEKAQKSDGIEHLAEGLNDPNVRLSQHQAIVLGRTVGEGDCNSLIA